MNKVVLYIIMAVLAMAGLSGCTIEPVRTIYTPAPVYQTPRYVAPAPDPVYYMLPNGQVVQQQWQYHSNYGWRPVAPLPPGAVLYFRNQHERDRHFESPNRYGQPHFGGRSPQHDDRKCMNAPEWHKDHGKYCH